VRLLALDFDGVISDSAPECFVVALHTYAAMRPGTSLDRIRDRVDALPVTAVHLDAAYLEFVELMPLGNRAEDFGVVLSILDAGLVVSDQRAYDEVRDTAGRAFLETFHERFYRFRRDIRTSDPERWSKLLGPYPKFVDLLKRRAGDTILALATAKDRESALLLLADYGLGDVVPEDRVLDKEAGPDKKAHLRALSERLGVPFKEITFIDDKVNHLDGVAPLGVRCALAAWGYNGERERTEARSRGHLVCTLSDVERQLFG
jgi:phosphoglycolate phosphatase-like HAD superfamily hydrolase